METTKFFAIDNEFELNWHTNAQEAIEDALAAQKWNTTAFRVDFDTKAKTFTFTELELPKSEYWYRTENGKGVWPAFDYLGDVGISDVYVKEANGDLRLLAGTERDDAIKAITGGAS